MNGLPICGLLRNTFQLSTAHALLCASTLKAKRLAYKPGGRTCINGQIFNSDMNMPLTLRYTFLMIFMTNVSNFVFKESKEKY